MSKKHEAAKSVVPPAAPEGAAHSVQEGGAMSRPRKWQVEIPRCLAGRKIIEAETPGEALEKYMEAASIIRTEHLPIIQLCDDDAPLRG